MAPVTGDTVRVHYTGTLSDGTTFDSSDGRDPLEFTIGSGQVIPGFDIAVADLEVGDTATVNIAAADAYGERSDEGMQTFPRDAFPPDAAPEVGWAVELSSPDGERVPATVAEVTDESITLDFNHPLAGQDLTFEITLVEIV
jgi:FKBP-type peptidyl-prolyl cis-trans isomerase 2